MSRKLDFVVFGVPRSGTTAMGQYLSASHQVHCFLEVIEGKRNHSRITAPDSFLEILAHRRARDSGEDEAKVLADMRARFDARSGAVRLYGHKRPNYYHHLQKVVDQSGCGKGILCYRAVGKVAESFARRAADGSDGWHAGRVGMFAALEAIVMAHAVGNVTGIDILVVPQRAMAADWEGTIRQTVAFVDPGVELTFREAELQRIHDRKDAAQASTPPALADADRTVVERVQRSGLDDLLDRAEPFPLSEVRSELLAVAAQLPRHPIAFAGKHAKTHPNPAVAEFTQMWQERVKKGWKPLRRAMQQAGGATPAAEGAA